MLISLGIIDWLKSLNVNAKIKWPNDILIGNKKIAGILIENKTNSKEIRQSIIGIGVNVNQKQFFKELEKSASSIFNETGLFTQNLEQACLDLLTSIYLRVENHKMNMLSSEELLTEYNKNLFLKDIISKYSSNNTTFEATLIKVNENGQLYLLKDNKEITFYFKEVVFVLQ